MGRLDSLLLQEVLNLFVDGNPSSLSHRTSRWRNCFRRHWNAFWVDREVRLLVRGVLLLGLGLTGCFLMMDYFFSTFTVLNIRWISDIWRILKSWSIHGCVHHACNKNCLGCDIWLNRVGSAWICSTFIIDPLNFPNSSLMVRQAMPFSSSLKPVRGLRW